MYGEVEQAMIFRVFSSIRNREHQVKKTIALLKLETYFFTEYT